MKRIFRFFWLGALILVLAVTACAPTNQTPFPVPPGFQTLAPANNSTATSLGTDTTSTAATAITETLSVTETVAISPTSGTVTAQIPVTGLNVIPLDCPFCVNEKAYTLMLLPDTATFKVVSNTTSNSPTCTTIDVANGKQVVMCAGAKKSQFTLNVCNGSGGCIDQPVVLIDCIVPGIPTTGPNTATGIPSIPTNTPTPPPTNTSAPPTITNTAIPPATVTSTPASVDTATPTP